ncbi:MAG: MarC family protein [Betaproteobacteria bacterium]|nr:MarC family protein [Betaproteobacteria bacterium]
MKHDFISAFMLLFLVLDPLGNIPVVLSLLRHVPESRRRHVILRECLIAGLLLIGFLFIGARLLTAMHLSEPSLAIAGGVILFLIALRMAFPPDHGASHENERSEEPFIVPLAIPMLAGPSALTTVMLASRQTDDTAMWVGVIVITTIINACIMLASWWLSKLFGKAGIAALERLMGLILTAIAVEMLISGIKIAFHLA